MVSAVSCCPAVPSGSKTRDSSSRRALAATSRAALVSRYQAPRKRRAGLTSGWGHGSTTPVELVGAIGPLTRLTDQSARRWSAPSDRRHSGSRNGGGLAEVRGRHPIPGWRHPAGRAVLTELADPGRCPGRQRSLRLCCGSRGSPARRPLGTYGGLVFIERPQLARNAAGATRRA